jgi:hypothetical protein
VRQHKPHVLGRRQWRRSRRRWCPRWELTYRIAIGRRCLLQLRGRRSTRHHLARYPRWRDDAPLRDLRLPQLKGEALPLDNFLHLRGFHGDRASGPPPSRALAIDKRGCGLPSSSTLTVEGVRVEEPVDVLSRFLNRSQRLKRGHSRTCRGRGSQPGTVCPTREAQNHPTCWIRGRTSGARVDREAGSSVGA